jgi:hypothetical protein
MAVISPAELIEYFENRARQFTNAKGMELGLTAKWNSGQPTL